MPHCELEYSANVLDKPDNHIILKAIHDVLDRTKLFSLNDIKSRVTVHRDYLIGDGGQDRAFVALNISILSGKDEAAKKRISEDCIQILKDFFPKSIETLKLSITVQILEMDKGTYARLKNY
jgi:5-carboxymethyl-2-hydroxymuconate isomerase